ncbi:MAG: ATP-binding protein [Bacteroidetes bacterium]|nr:ATP-binding protein [Bacteroidota bacterium]
MGKDRLIVKNFGPIREADVELGKITVFIGEQASGKSVLAKLALLLRNPRASQNKRHIYNWITLGFQDLNISNFLNKNSIGLFYTDQFIFGFEKEEGFREVKDKDLDKLLSILHNIEVDIRNNERDNLLKESYRSNQERFSLGLEAVKSRLNKSFFLEPVYIPTERHLVSVLVQSLFNLIKHEVSLPNFIKDLGDRYQSSRNIARQVDLPGMNLQYIFGGHDDKIRLENGKLLDLTESSSGVQSIVPLSIIVEAVNENVNHLFIVEEPELNLYPTTQKALVEYLIEKCTKGNNRLIITTHSPYILTALNNCIQAQNVIDLHPESAEEVNRIIPPQYHIKYEDVKAYHVAGGTAKPIMDDEFQVIDANALDDVSNELGSVFDKLLTLKYQNQD